ncbi:hypothetical protein [Apibacter adventoris]|uniref:hypothetical protein n=1 Tax=Apibacter adventoris TaxID=1679466 RepID=UPI001C889891|nr:hypothetical protein [Apibacter adventoris]
MAYIRIKIQDVPNVYKKVILLIVNFLGIIKTGKIEKDINIDKTTKSIYITEYRIGTKL